MIDPAAVVLTATLWTYWLGVGVMVARARRRTHRLGGLVPEQPLERLMWVVWVPLIAAWMSLPYLALTRTHPLLALPDWATERPMIFVRILAAALAVACLALTVECWKRMGASWSMGIVSVKSELVTSGLYRIVRHPIYALSVSLMLCSALIVPTPPMLVVAVLHVLLMVMKARNEERYLLRTHGEVYRRYLERTGRFLPRPGSLR